MTVQAHIELPGPLRAVAVAPAAQAAGAPEGAPAPLDQRRRRLEQERERLAQARQALAAAGGRFRQLQADLIAEAEQQLLDLALDIARKVLMQEIQAGRYEIDPIVTEAMRHVPSRRDVVVHLHPDDYAQCRAAEQLGDDSDGIRFLADPNVGRAECLLETREGVVESAVEPGLARVSEALRNAE